MQVLGIAWIGVWSERAQELRAIFGDVMGMDATKDEPEAGWFQLASARGTAGARSRGPGSGMGGCPSRGAG